ncbi:MAG: MFS transporter [Anaerolineae bacterium]|nr:MFS transporter [Anaerolineae bacterium]
MQPNPLPLKRLLAVSVFSLALTLSTNTLEPAVYGSKFLQLSPDSPNTTLGFATSAGSLAALFFSPFVGELSDRTKTRWGNRVPFFFAGTFFAICALYTIATAPALLVLVAGILLYELSASTISNPWQALFPDLVPQGQRGRASGLKGMLDILGLIVGRLIAGKIISNRSGFFQHPTLAAISLPAAVLIMSFIITAITVKKISSNNPPPLKTITEKRVNKPAPINFREYPAFIWWFANRFFYWTAFIILGTFLLFFAIDVVGLSESNAQNYIANLTTVLGGAILIASLPAGWLADKIGRKPLVIASGFLAFLGTAVILVVKNITLLTIGGGMIGLASGIFISANFALITDIVPASQAARFLGIASIASASGNVIGRSLGGLIVDPVNRFYDSSSLGYLILYSIAAIFFLLSAVSAIQLPAPPISNSNDF